MTDTLIVNTAQAAAWNGYEGEHWAANDDRYDTVNIGFNQPLLDAAAIAETSRVLDVGCGNGKLTRLAARRARHGQAIGLDLSAPMLARARARAAEENIRNVTFEQGDAQVYPFPPGGFDVAVSITRARAALEDALAPFATPDGLVLRGAAWLVTAQRPGG